MRAPGDGDTEETERRREIERIGDMSRYKTGSFLDKLPHKGKLTLRILHTLVSLIFLEIR